jgi:hypothetical protein
MIMECIVQAMDNFSLAATQLETVYMHIDGKKKSKELCRTYSIIGIPFIIRTRTQPPLKAVARYRTKKQPTRLVQDKFTTSVITN